jgi:hypothetical protein
VFDLRDESRKHKRGNVRKEGKSEKQQTRQKYRADLLRGREILRESRLRTLEEGVNGLSVSDFE